MLKPKQKPNLLQARFGGPKYYQDIFEGLTYCHVGGLFDVMEANKAKSDQAVYEATRQEFVKMYGKFRGPWRATDSSSDHLVEVTRLYSHGNEYVAFMRIQPNGFRSERFVPFYMDIKFHLLLGKVIVIYKKRTRTMTRGSHLQIFPKSTVSMRSVCPYQDAVFVFKVTIDMNRQRFFYA